MKRTKLADMPPNPNSIVACLERGERVSFGIGGTNSQFMSGKQTGDEVLKRYGPVFAARMEKKARKLGISTAGKAYISQLATEFCDPRALVSDTSDVVARCKALNRASEGMVNVERYETPPTPPVAIGNDIIARRMQDAIAEDPSLGSKKKIEGLREKVVAEATPHWKRK